MGEERPEGILENVVTYFVYKKVPRLGVTKLMKLLYLAEVYHRQLTGHSLLRLRFRHRDHGPCALKMYDAIDRLSRKAILQPLREEVLVEYTFKPVRPAAADAMVSLDEEQLSTLRAVLSDWGDADLTKDILPYVYDNPPFAGTAFNQEIDFSKSDPVVAASRETGKSPSEIATEIIEDSPELLEGVLEGDRAAREGRFVPEEEVFDV